MPKGPAGGPRPFSQSHITIIFEFNDGTIKNHIERYPDPNKIREQIEQIAGMPIMGFDLNLTNDQLRVEFRGGRMVKERVNELEQMMNTIVGAVQRTIIISE